MVTLIHCPTNVAVLLVAVKRNDGLILVPSDPGDIPGIIIAVDTCLPINPQLLAAAEKRTGLGMSDLSIWQEFQTEVTLPSGDLATVYAAQTLRSPTVIPPDARTLPELMRSMPANRNRVAYMKVLQVFSGALDEQTKALDLDEVKRHIQSLNPRSEI
jgi:hypothetical protein